MTLWQENFLISFGIFNLVFLIWSYNKTKNKGEAYGLTLLLFPLGMFVWGDVLLIAPFWVGVSFVSLYLNDWILFLLIISSFWTVRAWGEANYWFNQQFSKVIRYKPEDLPFYQLCGNDAAYFMHQVLAQLVAVVSLVFTIYYASIWI